jgi:hypothetical protein
MHKLLDMPHFLCQIPGYMKSHKEMFLNYKVLTILVIIILKKFTLQIEDPFVFDYIYTHIYIYIHMYVHDSI